jgi:CRP-like cAMP-binding protein
MAENPLFEKYGQTVPAGREIFHEGDHGEMMYIIQSGTVRITKSIDGKEHELAQLGKGDFFGEMAIVSQIRRTATAVAAGEVQLLAFDRQGFQSMIEKNAKIAMNVIDKLCRRLERANAQIQQLFQKNQRSLVALNLNYKFLERPEDNRVLALDRAVKDLSMALEVPAEAVSETIQQLAQAGIVSISGNALRLQNEDKLTAIADEIGG